MGEVRGVGGRVGQSGVSQPPVNTHLTTVSYRSRSGSLSLTQGFHENNGSQGGKVTMLKLL